MFDEATCRYADKHGEKEFQKGLKRRQRRANKQAEALGDAALFGYTEKVHRLLQAGAEPNVLTACGCGKSPLMMAAMYSHIAVMRALLRAGADPNLAGDAEYDSGQTALMYAVSSYWSENCAEVVKFLVEQGAKLNSEMMVLTEVRRKSAPLLRSKFESISATPSRTRPSGLW